MPSYPPRTMQAPPGAGINRSRQAPRNQPSMAAPNLAAAGNLKTILAQAAQRAQRPQVKGRPRRPHSRRPVPGMNRGAVAQTRPPQMGAGPLNSTY